MDALSLKVLAVLAIANVALSALDAGLAKLKEMLPENAGVSKAAKVSHSIVDGLQAIVKFVSANRPTAPAVAEKPQS
jgi:hypothetical protein